MSLRRDELPLVQETCSIALCGFVLLRLTRVNDETNPACDEQSAEGLPARERSGQRRVRLAEIFDDDPDQGVEQEEKTGQHAARLPSADTQKPETTEEQ